MVRNLGSVIVLLGLIASPAAAQTAPVALTAFVPAEASAPGRGAFAKGQARALWQAWAPESKALALAPAWATAEPWLARDTIPPASAASATAPLDLRIAREFRSPAYQRNGAMHAASTALRSVAIPGTLLIAGALYGVGQATDDAGLSDLGLDTGEAIAGAGVVSLVGKIAVGRARPSTSPLDPRDLRFGRGLRGDAYQSFPSAHTAAAFATAAVLASELDDDDPGRRVWLVPLLYGSATLAGLSRLYDDEHWATDVLGGALVGTLSGFAIANDWLTN